MRRRTISLTVLSIVFALTLSFATVLPATSQDISKVKSDLERLRGMLENEHPSLENKVNAVIHQIEAGAFNGALNKMTNDVKKSVEAQVDNPSKELLDLIDLITQEIDDLLHHKPTPDFKITAYPTTLIIAQGGFATSTITVTSEHGFNQTVTLNGTALAPFGVTLLFSLSQVKPPPNGSVNSTLRVDVASNVSARSYKLIVIGTSDSFWHSVTIDLFVTGPTPDFFLSATPSARTIQQGGSNTSIITVTPIQGFIEAVDLAVTSAKIPGVNTTLYPTSVEPLGISLLTINVATNASLGTFSIVVTGKSGSLTHNVTISLTVTTPPTPPKPDFSVNVYPTTLTIVQGDSATSTIIVASLRGFNKTVSLAAEAQLVKGTDVSNVVTLSLNPAHVTLEPNGMVFSTLNVSVGKTQIPIFFSQYVITVTGTSGSLTRTVSVYVLITSEKKPPIIVSVLRLPEKPIYNQAATVLVSVIDEDSGVKNVILNYAAGETAKNVTMALKEGVYTADIPAFPFNSQVQYRIYASDNAGNWATSNTYYYVIIDPYPPVIGTPTWSPLEPAANEKITINVTVTKPVNASDIDRVTLWYKNKTQDTWYSKPMAWMDGNWSADLTDQSDTQVEFFVGAVDNAGNSAESQKQKFTVAAPPSVPLAWILAAILIIVAAIGGSYYYVRSKEKKRQAASSVPVAATSTPATNTVSRRTRSRVSTRSVRLS